MVKSRLRNGGSVVFASFLLAVAAAASAETPTDMMGTADLATLRDLDSVSLSPDGAWVAFQVIQANPLHNNYDTRWFVLATSGGGPPRPIANAGELKQSDATANFRPAPPPTWSPDGRWVVYLRTDSARTQIWRAYRDGSREEQLTRNDSDVRALAFARDGRRILFETQPSSEETRAALSTEGLTGFLYDRRFVPSHGKGPVRAADSEFVEGTYERRSLAEVRARRVWVYDLVTRRERQATDDEGAEFAALVAAPRPPDRSLVRGQTIIAPAGAMVWTEARDAARQGGLAPLTIIALPHGTTEPVVCAAAECTGQRIEVIGWRDDGDVVFAKREGHPMQETSLYTWRPGKATLPRLVLRTSDMLVADPRRSCRVARSRLICFHEQSNYPRRLVSVDLDVGAINTLYDPNPHFGRFDLGAIPRRIDFRTASGVETFGYLVLPPGYAGRERLPLVIVTYRCSGFLRGGTGDEYPIFPLAAQGHAVLCINAPDVNYERLEAMDWRASEALDRGEGDPEKHRMQDCLNVAVADLAAMGIVDPNRVGLTGLSFGAETVHFALFSMPTLAAAIASGGGNEPSSTFLAPIGSREITSPWGLASANSRRWDALALSRNVQRVRAPLLLNVADHEMIAVLEPFSALREAGRAVEMHVFPDEYHIKWQPAHRLAIYNRNIDWMNFWLREKEDSEPAKAAQYARWRDLRDRVRSLEPH